MSDTMFLAIVMPIFIFVLGICWGSFLNVWIYRIPEKRSVAGGRSACMTCDHSLGPLDLVPVFSFLFLRAKCRYCKTKLSWQYPAIELLVGLLFLLTYYTVGLNWHLWLVTGFVVTVNVVMAKIDWNTALIPNILTYPSIVIAVIYVALTNIIPNYKDDYINYPTFDLVVPAPSLIEGIIVGFGFFFLLLLFFFATKGGIGMGDVKWILFMGIMLGYQLMFFALILGTLLSCIFSVIVYSLFKSKIKALPDVPSSITDKDEPITQKIYGVSIVNGKPAIVLGPFLAIGMLVAWFFGIPLYDWYLGV